MCNKGQENKDLEVDILKHRYKSFSIKYYFGIYRNITQKGQFTLTGRFYSVTVRAEH